MNMYELIKKGYLEVQKYGFADKFIREDNTIEDFDNILKDNVNCLEIIRSNMFYRPKNFAVNKAYSYRFRHIVICWLMGVGFMEYIFPQKESINYLLHKQWLLSAFTHDYGWFCEETLGENPMPKKDFKDSFGDVFLLKDTYETPSLHSLNNFLNKNKDIMSATYGEILEYYESSIRYHERVKEEDPNKFDPEYCDHGVVGGCVAFKEYNDSVEKIRKRKKDESGIDFDDGIRIKELNKVACLITAAHNVWGKRIEKNNRLLLLMALVDSIECYKRFAIMKKGKVNPEAYIGWKIIYDNINVEIKDNTIELDYSMLRKYIQKKRKDRENEFISCLDGYIYSLTGEINKPKSGLKGWTSYTAEKVNEDIITIREMTDEEIDELKNKD